MQAGTAAIMVVGLFIKATERDNPAQVTPLHVSSQCPTARAGCNNDCPSLNTHANHAAQDS